MGGNYMSALEKPIRHGDEAKLNEVLDRYGPVTPLLLSKRFTPQDGCCGFSVTETFQTPLQYCIMQNQPQCLRILLDAGGDPREKSKTGLNLLHQACKRDSLECVKVLLEYGADPHDHDEWGVYPIHLCVGAYGKSEDSLKILDMLLDSGSRDDINVKDSEYHKTPLHYAAYYGNMKMCKRLLQLGADINAKDRTERTPYHSAQHQRALQIYLKDQGADTTEAKPIPPYPQAPISQNLPERPKSSAMAGALVASIEPSSISHS